MAERFIIDTHGPDPEGIRVALQAAEIICEREGCSALLCVPAKSTAKQTILHQVIPEWQIRRLLKGEKMQLNGKVDLRLESQKTLSTHVPHGVVIALHGSPAMMAKIDSIVECKAIVMVPWTEAEGLGWKTQWDSIVLR